MDDGRRAMTASVIGNQAAPAGARRGRATWRDDLLAYDALPFELRLQLQTTPFEMDAAAVLMGYRQLRAHHGSELMAIAMTAGQIDQFMQEILA
jgi:hypothetical protein